ncbi:MAG TPA: protein-L-isoaspartate(D-aspartate) O-methyltransferase [Nevskiaceae bacterium]|nr:protein-L-isoaspartate(D-aspartate) O-methyltransferase [Nevskiaceae bacterium]
MTPTFAGAASELAMPRAAARLIEELRHDGINDERVLAAMARVPRPRFVEPAWQTQAWKNRPLPIGQSQTISQPFVVALMTQLLLEAGPRQRVLEIGTGSGYQSAVLASVVDGVYSVERIRDLSAQARQRLRALGFDNIHFGYADGSEGWDAHAPFDGILVTAAATAVPPALCEQLAPGGRLVIPVGQGAMQRLRVVDRRREGLVSRDVATVSFVPLLKGRV